MLRLNRLFPILILGILLISACLTNHPLAIEQTLSQGLRPDAPPYAIHGPFAVGYKQLIVGNDTAHPLEVSLWYPALNPERAKEEIPYVIKNKDATWSPKQPTIVYGHALLDAKIDGSYGPYPLIVFSHGFSASAPLYNVLLEHYASYGFIILAPEHAEQLDTSWGDLWKSSIDRPRDMKQTLDMLNRLLRLMETWPA